MTDEIMLDRLEGEQNAYWSYYGRGGMYDPEEDGLAHLCGAKRSIPDYLDEGTEITGGGAKKYECECV